MQRNKSLEELKQEWLAEESIAHIHGWDFSHINDRYEEEDNLPWNYGETIKKYLTPEMKLLDTDTGGGEFLLSLGHPYENTAATEGYPPNVKLCEDVLLPLGIDFREVADAGKLPFDGESFDMVINRHGDFDAEEIHRILKPGGLFITQQVGAENDRELVGMLLPGSEMPYPEQYLAAACEKFVRAGFDIIEEGEAFPEIRFYDVGALVWFARIIEWEFPGFSVEDCFDRLRAAQEILEDKGVIQGTTHRFMLVARKR